MYKDTTGKLVYSPTDLIRFMESPFASWMERLHLEHPGRAEPDPENEERKLIATTGDIHEKKFLENLQAQHKDVCIIIKNDSAIQSTLAAIKANREIIYQACLELKPFRGYADFLVRSMDTSAGTPHYELLDTKLARKTKPYYLIQLCCYAEMLAAVQGQLPAKLQVALGDNSIQEFCTADFFHYYLMLKEAFLRQMKDFNPEQQPLPEPRADHGRWASYAEKMLLASDHLVQVAGITVGQIKKLNAAGITTVAELAQSTDIVVPKFQTDILTRLCEQASLQVQTRELRAKAKPDETITPVYRVISPSADQPRGGLALLPLSSPLDVYFDMEGFPLVEGGLEYLFGATYLENGKPIFVDWWAHDALGEKSALEGFIDWAYARWKADPSMHIYHYASYEVSAVRRLMGKYATREDEVDDLLRHEVFVDLFQIVRQGLRVGEPNYSIKSIEHLYRPMRKGGVGTAGESMVYYAYWLESGESPKWQDSPILNSIREYNRDDCESTWLLAEWLRARQKENSIHYQPPHAKEDEPAGNDPEKEAQIIAYAELNAHLTKKANEDSDAESRQIAGLLKDILEFHRREEKPTWWQMFERASLTHEELKDDLNCIGDATLVSGSPEAVKQSFVFTYRFDPWQETKINVGDRVMFNHNINAKAEVVELDGDNGQLKIKIGKKALSEKLDGQAPSHTSFLPVEHVPAVGIKQAIFDTAAAWNSQHQLPNALRRFLLRQPPHLPDQKKDEPLARDGEEMVATAVRIVSAMEDSTLCLQGPPGTGKTFTAARMIAALLSHGKKVGITSNSHKAITNLLSAIQEVPDCNLHGIKVGGDTNDPELAKCPGIAYVQSTSEAHSEFSGGGVAGTAWLFVRPEWEKELDYLFVDEAGQVSLANLVAMSRCARNLVLLGDQMQLQQPVQGSHPGESGLAALEYYLNGHATIPSTLGLFLPETRRLHPAICKFISELVYEGRLKSCVGNEMRKIIVPGTSGEIEAFSREAGLYFIPVIHDGNIQSSDEEADKIVRLATSLLGRSVTNEKGQPAGAIGWADMLFVAPYNLQVRKLRERLPSEARVGSVDKFQGQEAEIVFISLCSSFGEYGSRGIEFILDQNRMNVAISRARVLAIVVGDSRIATTPCTTIDSMRRLNLLCRLVLEHSYK